MATPEQLSLAIRMWSHIQVRQLITDKGNSGMLHTKASAGTPA
jgi:hypothetical protein